MLTTLKKMSRVGLAIGLLTLMLGVLAAMPGSFGDAFAETAGPFTDDTSGASTGGTTTTTSTLPGGGTATTTTTTTGTGPTATTTTTTTTPAGTITTVQTPGGQSSTTVTLTNPTAPLTATTAELTVNIPPGTMTQGQALEVIAQAVAAKAEELGVDPANITVTLTFNVQRIDFAGETASVRAVKIFELNVRNQNGSTGQIAKPVLITWDFTPADLAGAGGNFANLLMIGYDETTKTWSAVKQVSSTSTSVTFEVPHFSTWAFAIRNTVATQPAPPTAATPGTTAPTTPAQAATPAGAGTAGAGAAVPPGAVIPRPANTGTGIPAESGVNAVLPYALAVLGLGLAGGIALRTVRRRS